MKNNIILWLICAWLLILTCFALVFYNKTEQINTVVAKQHHQEEILLKQAEILAVNTTLLQALFQMLHSGAAQPADSEIPTQMERIGSPK